MCVYESSHPHYTPGNKCMYVCVYMRVHTLAAHPVISVTSACLSQNCSQLQYGCTCTGGCTGQCSDCSGQWLVIPIGTTTVSHHTWEPIVHSFSYSLHLYTGTRLDQYLRGEGAYELLVVDRASCWFSSSYILAAECCHHWVLQHCVTLRQHL